MRQLKDQIPEQDSYLGQRQVDVYAGLNVMILLLELHRYAKEKKDLDIQFYPCGKPNDKGKLDDSRLLSRLMGYSECLGNDGFLEVMGRFLSGANLNRANLISADLISADLISADLISADLSGADLDNIIWDEETRWDNVQGLKTAQNLPEALKQQLGLE